MRIRAPRGGIIVRFYDYAGDEAPKVPELGPFYALVVGKREVRADDKLIAIRSTDVSPWTLTDAIRPGIAGINKADFSVFSLSARDPRAAPQPRPQVAPPVAPPVGPQVAPPPQPAPPAAPIRTADNRWAPAETVFAERRKVEREIYVARPSPVQEEQLTPADVNLILRVDKLKQQELAQQLMVERLRREQHADPEIALRTEAVQSLPMRFQPPVKERTVAEASAKEYEEVPFTERLLGFLWSARLVIITLLIAAAAASAYGYLRASAAPSGPPPLTFAAVGDKIQTPDWTYTVVSVERPHSIAASPPTSGGYLIVHITVTRKNPDAAALDPIAFTLIDSKGARALAFPSSSDVYAPGTGLLWATRYPMNTLVRDHLAYDINPGAEGLLFLITSANVEVRLPDP